MELLHRFRVRIMVNCDSLTCSFNPNPEHLRDSRNGTFITHGNSDFMGMFEITINKPRLLAAKYPIWEYPVIKVVFLLRDTTRSWAAVFGTNSEDTIFDPCDGLDHRNSKDPYLLHAVRFALRPLLEEGLPTPTSLIVLQKPKFRNTIATLCREDMEAYAVKVTLHREHRPNNIA